MGDVELSSVLDRIAAVKDAMTVSRAFGEAYQVDDVTVIPVATVRGGVGGGQGQGRVADEGGSGAGMGFGVLVRPVGVYTVKEGTVTWQPAFDVMRVIIGGQVLGLAAILTARRILRRH